MKKMMNEIMIGVLLIWAALSHSMSMATVQTDLFGGRAVTGVKETVERIVVKLHELMKDAKSGSIQRRIGSWFIDPEGRFVALNFADDTTAYLWFVPTPETLKEWPSMKGDGEHFSRAVAFLTGATIATSADLEAALDSVAPKVMTLHLETKTSRNGRPFTAYRVSAKHPPKSAK